MSDAKAEARKAASKVGTSVVGGHATVGTSSSSTSVSSSSSSSPSGGGVSEVQKQLELNKINAQNVTPSQYEGLSDAAKAELQKQGYDPSSGSSSTAKESEATKEADQYRLNPNRSAGASATDQESFNKALIASIKKTGGNIGDYFLRPEGPTEEAEEPKVKYDDPYFAYKYQESKGLTPSGESIAELRRQELIEQAKPSKFLDLTPPQPTAPSEPLVTKVGGADVLTSLLGPAAREQAGLPPPDYQNIEPMFGQLEVKQKQGSQDRELTTKNLRDFLFTENKEAARFLVTFEGGETKTIPKDQAYHKVLGLLKEGKAFSISPGFDYKVNLSEGGAKEGEYLTTKNLREFLFDKNKDAQAFQIIKGGEGQKAEIINIPKDEAYHKVLGLFKEQKAFTITPIPKEGVKFEANTMSMLGLVPPAQKGTKAEQTLEKSIKDVQKFAEENKGKPLGFIAGLAKQGLGFGAFIHNVGREADKTIEKAITGKSTTAYSIAVPYGPLEYPISTAIGGITSGDLVASELKARETLMQHISKVGGYGIAGEIAFEVLPFVPLAKKAFPLASPTFKAITESGQVKTIARTVEVGFGSKTKEVLTVINNKPYFGGPSKYLGKSALKEIEAVDRGVEFSTQGKLGTKILTSEEGLKVLFESGKALPRDVEAAGLHKELAGIIKFSSENVPQSLRKKAATIPSEPLFTVKAGAESEALVKEVIPELATMKGTLAETVQLERDLIGAKGGALSKIVSEPPVAIKTRTKPTEQREIFHGTTGEGATRLLKKGLEFSSRGGFFATPTYREAQHWGDVVLKIKLKPEAKIIVEKKSGVIRKQNPLEVEYVPGPWGEREYFIVSQKPIEKIELAGLTPKINKDPLADLRSKTTGDIDVDYQGFFGEIKAHQVAKRATDILNKVAEEGRTFEKRGTNVMVTEKGKSETVLNILTKKDEKTGYLNKGDLKPFGIDLGSKEIKVAVSEGSKDVGKFVTIEQQALNRIESSFALQGPKSDKYRGQGPIPYLKEGAKIQQTEKGYTILPTEHRFKDLSKLVSQDTEQIARNLKQAGHPKQAIRATEIKEKLIKLYPEIDFGIKEEAFTIEEAVRSSSKLASLGKQSVLPSSALGLQVAQTGYPLSRKERRALREERRAARNQPKSIYKPIERKSIYKPITYSSLAASTSKPSSLLGSLSSTKLSSLSKLSSSMDSSLSKGSPSKASFAKSFSAFVGSSGSPGGSPLRSSGRGSASKGSSGGSPLSGLGGGSSGGSPGGSPLSGLSGGPSGVPGRVIPPPKIIPVVIPLWKTRVDKEKPGPTKPRADFLGSAKESDIQGLYNRDITYGLSKIDKLLRKERKGDRQRSVSGFLSGSSRKKTKSRKKRFSFL